MREAMKKGNTNFNQEAIKSTEQQRNLHSDKDQVEHTVHKKVGPLIRCPAGETQLHKKEIKQNAED
jgi:hypothetical protein